MDFLGGGWTTAIRTRIRTPTQPSSTRILRSVSSVRSALEAGSGSRLQAAGTPDYHSPMPHPGGVPAMLHSVPLRGALVEIDVHRTKDGQLILIHDTTPARTTDVEQVSPTARVAGRRLHLRVEHGCVTSSSGPGRLDRMTSSRRRAAGSRPGFEEFSNGAFRRGTRTRQ